MTVTICTFAASISCPALHRSATRSRLIMIATDISPDGEPYSRSRISVGESTEIPHGTRNLPGQHDVPSCTRRSLQLRQFRRAQLQGRSRQPRRSQRQPTKGTTPEVAHERLAVGGVCESTSEWKTLASGRLCDCISEGKNWLQEHMTTDDHMCFADRDTEVAGKAWRMKIESISIRTLSCSIT